MTIAGDAFRVQRLGDPVACTFSCESCTPCAPGSIITGVPNFFIENQPVATVGSLCSNCSGPCSCCISPNAIVSGSKFGLLYNGVSVARKMDIVANGFFLGGAIRTFIGGV
jgi:uncharacterized Zn-binding protein involved in type VI secretion